MSYHRLVLDDMVLTVPEILVAFPGATFARVARVLSTWYPDYDIPLSSLRMALDRLTRDSVIVQYAFDNTGYIYLAETTWKMVKTQGAGFPMQIGVEEHYCHEANRDFR